MVDESKCVWAGVGKKAFGAKSGKPRISFVLACSAQALAMTACGGEKDNSGDNPNDPKNPGDNGNPTLQIVDPVAKPLVLSSKRLAVSMWIARMGFSASRAPARRNAMHRMRVRWGAAMTVAVVSNRVQEVRNCAIAALKMSLPRA